MTNHWGFLLGFACGKLRQGHLVRSAVQGRRQPVSWCSLSSSCFIQPQTLSDPKGPCPSRRAELHFRLPSMCRLLALPTVSGRAPAWQLSTPLRNPLSTGDLPCDPEQVPPHPGLCCSLLSRWFISGKEDLTTYGDACCGTQLLCDKLSPSLAAMTPVICLLSSAVWAGLGQAVLPGSCGGHPWFLMGSVLEKPLSLALGPALPGVAGRPSSPCGLSGGPAQAPWCLSARGAHASSALPLLHTLRASHWSRPVMWPGLGPMGEDRRRASTEGWPSEEGRAPRPAWRPLCHSVLMQGRHGQTGGAEGLTVPVACLALRASPFAVVCASHEVRGQSVLWGQGPLCLLEQRPECQRWQCSMGVQSEFLWGSCHVLGLALAAGVRRNTMDCGVAWGPLGGPGARRGCQGVSSPPHFTTQCCPPSLEPHAPISCVLCPGPTHPHARKLPCGPFYPLHTQRVSPAPAPEAPGQPWAPRVICCPLTAVTRTKCSVALLIPPLPLTEPALSPHSAALHPSQSLHSHCSPDGAPAGLSASFTGQVLVFPASPGPGPYTHPHFAEEE